MKDTYGIANRIPNNYPEENKQHAERIMLRELADKLLSELFLPSMKTDERVRDTTRSDKFVLRLNRFEDNFMRSYRDLSPDTEIQYTLDVGSVDVISYVECEAPPMNFSYPEYVDDFTKLFIPVSVILLFIAILGWAL